MRVSIRTFIIDEFLKFSVDTPRSKEIQIRSVELFRDPDRDSIVTFGSSRLYIDTTCGSVTDSVPDINYVLRNNYDES